MGEYKDEFSLYSEDQLITISCVKRRVKPDISKINSITNEGWFFILRWVNFAKKYLTHKKSEMFKLYQKHTANKNLVRELEFPEANKHFQSICCKKIQKQPLADVLQNRCF